MACLNGPDSRQSPAMWTVGAFAVVLKRRAGIACSCWTRDRFVWRFKVRQRRSYRQVQDRGVPCPIMDKALAIAGVRQADAIQDGRGEVARLVRSRIVRHCEVAGTLPPRSEDET